MKTKKGFTLIELLVVISIIALLISILLPALNKARSQSKTTICVVNCKTMALAWTSYALDNDDKIVSSRTGYSTYFNELLYEPLICANPWTGWAGYPSESAPNNKERQTQAIEQGKLYPYLKTTDVYHCPASKAYELRCYSIPDILGSVTMKGHVSLGGEPVVTKTSQIKTPASRSVFLDEGYATFGGFTIYYSQPQWWDIPPIRHDNGVTLGIVDGHAEFYKWLDERTIDRNAGSFQPENPDLMKMQRGVYGSLGYEI